MLDFSDAMVFLIAVPNILGLYLFAPEIKRDVAAFMDAVAEGEVRNFRYEGLQDVPGTAD